MDGKQSMYKQWYLLISNYIPSGVVSTSETSTVSEELFVARGKKNMQLLYIDIGSENQFFAVKKSDQLVTLWYHDTFGFVPRHITILITYCRRSKTGRWEGLLDSCIWLHDNLPVTGYFTPLSKVSCKLQICYMQLMQCMKSTFYHIICQDSREHISQLTLSFISVSYMAVLHRWHFGCRKFLQMKVSAKVLKVVFT